MQQKKRSSWLKMSTFVNFRAREISVLVCISTQLSHTLTTERASVVRIHINNKTWKFLMSSPTNSFSGLFLPPVPAEEEVVVDNLLYLPQPLSLDYCLCSTTKAISSAYLIGITTTWLLLICLRVIYLFSFQGTAAVSQWATTMRCVNGGKFEILRAKLTQLSITLMLFYVPINRKLENAI